MLLRNKGSLFNFQTMESVFELHVSNFREIYSAFLLPFVSLSPANFCKLHYYLYIVRVYKIHILFYNLQFRRCLVLILFLNGFSILTVLLWQVFHFRFYFVLLHHVVDWSYLSNLLLFFPFKNGSSINAVFPEFQHVWNYLSFCTVFVLFYCTWRTIWLCAKSWLRFLFSLRTL